jgi:transposase-like protein
MARKHHKPEEIVAKLRQVEVLLAQGKTATEAVRTLGVTEQTYYRWRASTGAEAGPGEALKLLEQENGVCAKRGGSDAGEAGAEGSRLGKLVSAAVVGLRRARHGQAGRLAAVCLQVLGSTARCSAGPEGGRRRGGADDDITDLARQYGRYGYRRITALLRARAGLQSQAGGADLAARGAEGAGPSAQAWAAVGFFLRSELRCLADHH